MIKNRPHHSLRHSYLIISAFVSVIIIGATALSSFYVTKVTSQNAKALQLQETVSNIVSNIRRNNATTYTLLGELLLSPSDARSSDIKGFLASNAIQSKKLGEINGLEETGLLPQIEKLNKLVSMMNSDIIELLELRNDPQWIYPVLTIMNRDMLGTNVKFTSSVELMIHSMKEENILSNKEFILLNKLYSIRDTWRIMILNFRAVLLRFAGLNKVDQIEQERNITELLAQLSRDLSQLQELSSKGEYDLDVEEALNEMAQSRNDWRKHFKRFQSLREEAIWRNDIYFTTTNIRPVYDKTINILEKIDNTISKWAKRNTIAVEDTAYKINVELTALSVLALGFVIAIYIMLNRLVLTPIARISESLGKESHGEEFILPQRSSKEIYNLVSAYNRMRELIQQRQGALEHQALHDSLTGLPNRALLQDRLKHTINSAKRHNSPIAFMMIDLDRFKDINDTLGHQVGDRVLTQLGIRLQNCIRSSDTVARLGGDEFALIIPDANADEAISFAKKLNSVISEVLSIDNQNLFIDASIGISMFPENGKNCEVLVQYADIAMYHAKKNNLHFALFSPDMDKLSVDNLALLGDFRQELSHQTGQLQLLYQPKIDLSLHHVISVEALLRWHHPQQGFIPPEFVIRMAEQSGLIGDLTKWVISQAIHDCSIWQSNDIDIGVSVNLSAWNLQDPLLPELIQNNLESNQLHPSYLSLEITESAVMSDPARAREVLHELDEMGLALEIDDYGTGFSSLAYLKLLPVNTLKIDRSFVMDMLNDNNDLIIVRSTIDLAHNLGMTVIAEGVENNETLARLQKLKCDVAQGYFISKPLPREQFLQWLKSYNYEDMTV